MEFETERAAAKKKTARATVNAAVLHVLQNIHFRLGLSNADVGRFNAGYCAGVLELARVLIMAINGEDWEADK